VPLFIKTISRIDKYAKKITCLLNEEELILYVKDILKHHGQVNNVTSECIGHARKTGNNKYEISILSISGDASIISAYILLSEARNGPDANRTPSAKKPSDKQKEYTANKSRQTKKRGAPSVKEPSRNNAISLAFIEAQKKRDGKNQQ